MRMKIRRTEPSDAKGLQALYLDVEAYSQTLQLPISSLNVWENGISSLPNNIYSLVAVIDDEIVGNLSLTLNENLRLKHSAQVGIVVKDGFHRKGIGSRLLEVAIDLAENWLNLLRIELTVFVDNEKAIALYKKFGFEIEGEAKNFAFRDGKYINAYYMARIKRFEN